MASTSVCAAAGAEVRASFYALHDDDRPHACRFMRTAMGKLRRGQYESAGQFKREATATLKPRARDWESFFEFIQKLADLFAKLIPLFIK